MTVKVILGDNESIDIIYGDYKFSIEISRIENEQLPEFDLMLYKGNKSIEMTVNCWGKNLAISKPVDENSQHVRMSHQIVIPFGEVGEVETIWEYSAGKRCIVGAGNDCDCGDDKYVGESGVIVSNNGDGYCEVKLDNYEQETFHFGEYQLNLNAN
jgi:hypothetical protein